MSRSPDPRLPVWATVTLPDGRLAYRVAEGRGVLPDLFAARLRAGWSAERAAYERRPRVRQSPKVLRSSVLREARLASGRLAWPVAAAAGMSEQTFRARLRRGLSPDEAATLPVASRSQAAAARWKRDRRPSGSRSRLHALRLDDGRSALQVALQGGVPVATFRARLRRGWSLQSAALQPLATPSECAEAAGRRSTVASLRVDGPRDGR